MQPEHPTIEVKAFATDEALARTLEERAAGIAANIEAEPAVAAATARHGAAASRVAKLREANLRLMRRSRELFERLRAVAGEIEVSLIENGEAREEQSRGFVRVVKLESEHRITGQAASRLLERMLPEAEIEELQLRADACLARAAALRAVVDERIRRTAVLMAEAAEHEGEIVFDQGKTLSGDLRTKAEALEAEAMEHRRNAEERRIEHLNLLRRLDTIQALR